MKISKVSEFSILPYIQNRNSEISESVVLIDSGCNLGCKNDKKLTETQTYQDKYLKEKKEKFRGFRVFNFAPHSKSKTWKSRKVFFSVKF